MFSKFNIYTIVSICMANIVMYFEWISTSHKEITGNILSQLPNNSYVGFDVAEHLIFQTNECIYVKESIIKTLLQR